MKDIIKITQRDINQLPEGVYKIDTGLYLRVRGKYRNFFFKAQIDGSRREIGLGSSSEMSLSVAKAKALKIKAQIANGEFQLDKPAKKVVEKEKTFAEVAAEATEAIKYARRWKNEKHAHQWVQTIRDFANPVMGKKRISQITRDDILEVILPLWETKSETASRLLGRLERIMDYATFKGWYMLPNPARWKGNLELVLPPISKVRQQVHHEAMTAQEAQGIAVQFFDSDFLSHKAILFGLLTATRVSEFLNARWDEFDFEERVWSVPPERRKDGRNYPHRVPLCQQAIQMLESIERNDDLIFANKNGKRLHAETPRLTLIRILGRKVTMHGCRSTFRDWCAENAKDPILAEKSLMHTTGNEVEQAYQRSDLLEQRRVLMQEWADFLFNQPVS